MRVLKHIIRGCGYLPEVGEHPGTAYLLLVTVAGFAAGVQRGSILWALGGAGFMLAVYGSIYLYGAYGRSVLSDRLVKLQKGSKDD